MTKLVFIVASISGFLSVAIGAFGAHGLKKILEANQKVEVFETAVKYQMFHTCLLLIVGILMLQTEWKYLNQVFYFATTGIVIFSGSLYILAVTNISKLGMITPIGGLFFLAAWAMLFLSLIKS